MEPCCLPRWGVAGMLRSDGTPDLWRGPVATAQVHARAQAAEVIKEAIALARELVQGEERDMKPPRPRLNITEQKIVNTLAANGGRMVGKILAKACHLELSGTFSQTLAWLNRMRVIESNGDGYILNPYWEYLADGDGDSEETPEN